MDKKMTPYYLARPSIQTGDLIEWCSYKPLGWSIRLITGESVNHSSMALWDQQITGLHGTRRGDQSLYVGEALAGGFQRTYLSEEIKKYKGKVYWSPLKPEYDPLRLTLAWNLRQLIGRPYDTWSLFRNAWRRVPLDAEKLYCSEALQVAMIKTEILDREYSPTGKPKHAGTGIRPGEFEKIGLFVTTIRIK